MPEKSPSSQKGHLAPLLLLLFLVLAGGGYYYLTQVSAPPKAPVASGQIPIQAVDWDKSLYANPQYESLQAPITLPLEKGQHGNSHPFVEAAPANTQR